MLPRRFGAAAMSDAKTEPAVTLDATGLLCPLPVLKAKRALSSVPPGGVLEVLATDPGAVKDFEHFCRASGCEMLESSEQPGGVQKFLLKKPG
jgi:tRNA 2-thiouridine synthesizing protein A